MSLKFYNTMSRQLEEFTPIEAGKATLYTCGPTVYNYAHIGNFRAYIFEDILRRVLAFCGYEVTQVMNLTDVDDKTIRDSQAKGMELTAFTAIYKQAFFEDLATLRIEKAEHYPAATDHIAGMIALVESLLARGFAYVGEDKSVYFSIEKFEEYGRLARINREGQRSGVRINADEYSKEAVGDFALWKSYSEADGEVAWDSPWGKGRPGWHIECSAMSMHFLGSHFDIHTGGVDNMFPHHEDEIAQSVCATGDKFVNYWLHNEHLLVDGAKMSKSLGNFYTVRDLLGKGFSGREVRWLLMSAHYRQKLNFVTRDESDNVNFEGLETARTILKRLDAFVRRLKEAAGDATAGEALAVELGTACLEKFTAGVEDDLNMPVATAAVFDLLREANKAMDQKALAGAAAESLLDVCRRVDKVMGVLDVDAEERVPAEVLALVDERQAARKARDFARADAIRDQLLADGWVIKDTPKGPQVVRQ